MQSAPLMTFRPGIDVRLNLPGIDVFHRAWRCDGRVGLFVAIDGYAVFHGSADDPGDGDVVIPNAFLTSQLGEAQDFFGRVFIVGHAGGTLTVRIHGDEWRVIDDHSGTVLPSLLAVEANA